jgi:hypothetical protein
MKQVPTFFCTSIDVHNKPLFLPFFDKHNPSIEVTLPANLYIAEILKPIIFLFFPGLINKRLLQNNLLLFFSKTIFKKCFT